MTTSFEFRGRNYALNSQGELTEKEEVEAVSVMLGQTYKESAKRRGVSPETAKCQRASAKSKVKAHSLSEFIMAIISRGWLRPFLQGLLRRAAQKARILKSPSHTQARNRRCAEVLGPDPLQPLLCHPTHVDFPFHQLTSAQRDHVQKLSNANAVRYLAFLAAREEVSCL